MRRLRGKSNLEVSSRGFALFVLGLIFATFFGGALRTFLNSDQVHQRIVTELKGRFPDRTVAIGRTEVLLSRGLLPGLGLRLYDVNFTQDLCGKLTFKLNVPEADLPFSLWKLLFGKLKLGNVSLQGGRMALGFRPCLRPPLKPGAAAGSSPGPVQAAAPVVHVRLDWSGLEKYISSISFHDFQITYDKSPLWTIQVNRASVSVGHELYGRADMNVQKATPVGLLSHPLALGFDGNPDHLSWHASSEFKEGRLKLQGEFTDGGRRLAVGLDLHQIPIKDFFTEIYQLGLVNQEVKLRSTWLSASASWKGRVEAFNQSPLQLSKFDIEGDYGRADLLAPAALWWNEKEPFKEAIQIQVRDLKIHPILESLHREMLPAVLSTLGSWTGAVEYKNAGAWNMEGSWKGPEIVFSSHSIRGKQEIESLHTRVRRIDDRIEIAIDNVKLQKGRCKGRAEFRLRPDWRNGEFEIHLDQLSLSSSIQNLMMDGSIAPVSIKGTGKLKDGELAEWDGRVATDSASGSGWALKAASLQTRYQKNIFYLDGTVNQASMGAKAPLFARLSGVLAPKSTEAHWQDVEFKSKITASGGQLIKMTATQTPDQTPWLARGAWVREGQFSGSLKIGHGGSTRLFNVQGANSDLLIESGRRVR